MAMAKQGKSRASNQVDEQLSRYREMRDFAMTAEPSGNGKTLSKGADKNALPFVIQKHAATRLHYDFRLGWRGVLKSWAVTKGPSYYPGDKRLAVQVEDHPMEYGGFEGTIPKGQYGGGTVMVWDHGTWEPHVDVDEGLKKGNLKFALKGGKMHGNWALVRMGGKAANESKPNWLLIKEHDEFERAQDDPAITDEAPDSVVTKRNLDQIAAAEDHVWHSNRDGGLQTPDVKQAAASPKPARTAQTSKKTNKPAIVKSSAKTKRASANEDTGVDAAVDFSKELKGRPSEHLAKFVSPQLAVQADAAPEGDDWVHELKLDGYRIQIHVEELRGSRKSVKLYTRNGLDWTHRMPDIARRAAMLPVENALLDGEVVVMTSTGGTSFADLQAAFQEGKPQRLTYFAFDLLHLNGHNVRELPLVERKQLLQRILASSTESDDILRYSEHIQAGGKQLFENACSLGAEGIVSKLAAGKYLSGRGYSWLKIKCIRQQEFVIGGFTPPKKGGRGIGALLLGYYKDGKLLYAGRTGTGFSRATQKTLLERLEPIRREKMPFANVPRDAIRTVQWVDPKLVGEVAFATWTKDDLVRQAAFKGLREDKPAKDVRREAPVEVKKSAQIELSTSASRSSTKAPTLARKEGTKNGKESELEGLRLTHPDKILDKESGLTKRDLAEYYFAVADAMLPYIAGRPLSIVRCPEGSGKPCFFQKHVGMGVPPGIDGVEVRDKKGANPEEYLTISKRQGLAGLAQISVLEVHPWGSRNTNLERPDQLIFDLDPDPDLDWKVLANAALEIRKQLKRLGLESFLKTTGGKGLHVVAPIEPRLEWPEVKTFARSFAQSIEESNPELYLIKMTKSARKGKIFLDYFRNERGATAVAPYSPRARSGALVAVPLAWKELESASRPTFGVKNFPEWKSRLRRDPWAKQAKIKQTISEDALTKLGLGGK